MNIALEGFLGFHKISDQNDAGLEKEILTCTKGRVLGRLKCHNNGYDGALSWHL